MQRGIKQTYQKYTYTQFENELTLNLLHASESSDI